MRLDFAASLAITTVAAALSVGCQGHGDIEPPLAAPLRASALGGVSAHDLSQAMGPSQPAAAASLTRTDGPRHLLKNPQDQHTWL